LDYCREAAQKSAEEAGICTVLVKPVNDSMLFDCVERELGDAVDLADNGKIALEMVQSAVYELMLMDMRRCVWRPD